MMMFLFVIHHLKKKECTAEENCVVTEQTQNSPSKESSLRIQISVLISACQVISNTSHSVESMGNLIIHPIPLYNCRLSTSIKHASADFFSVHSLHIPFQSAYQSVSLSLCLCPLSDLATVYYYYHY